MSFRLERGFAASFFTARFVVPLLVVIAVVAAVVWRTR